MFEMVKVTRTLHKLSVPGGGSFWDEIVKANICPVLYVNESSPIVSMGDDDHRRLYQHIIEL